MTGRVLLVNAPWGRIYCPSMGLGLLKARLTENGIPCDVLYLHLDWYARLRAAFGAAAATQQFEQGTVAEQVGEWAFAVGRFGSDDPGLAHVRRHLLESAPTPAAAPLIAVTLSGSPSTSLSAPPPAAPITVLVSVSSAAVV